MSWSKRSKMITVHKKKNFDQIFRTNLLKSVLAADRVPWACHNERPFQITKLKQFLSQYIPE